MLFPITTQVADTLCLHVVDSLASWPTFPAVVQLGGIETRASSQILGAIENWLVSQGHANDFMIIPEYRVKGGPHPDETTDNPRKIAEYRARSQLIDYAIVSRPAIGQQRLKVEGLIEVKTNYGSQRRELKNRPKKAIQQASGYATTCGISDAYVLYIIVSVKAEKPQGEHDAGWDHFRPKTKLEATEPPIDSNLIVGQFPRKGSTGHPIRTTTWEGVFWACLLKA